MVIGVLPLYKCPWRLICNDTLSFLSLTKSQDKRFAWRRHDARWLNISTIACLCQSNLYLRGIQYIKCSIL